jgi:hypothetical protein
MSSNYERMVHYLRGASQNIPRFKNLLVQPSDDTRVHTLRRVYALFDNPPTCLDPQQMQDVLTYIRDVLFLDWDVFLHLLEQTDVWTNLERMFVTCYLDICIKLFNVCNRVEATSGLERPSLSTLYKDTIAKIGYNHDGTCYRIFYHDKTGRNRTTPTYIPMGPLWSTCMLLFLYKTRTSTNTRFVFSAASNANKPWRKNKASKEILAFIHTKTGLPTTIFPRQHMLRMLYINNKACEVDFEQESLSNIACIVRHSVGMLQTVYNTWTRLTHSMRVTKLPVVVFNKTITLSATVHAWCIQNFCSDLNAVTYKDDLYWYEDLPTLPHGTTLRYGRDILPRKNPPNKKQPRRDYTCFRTGRTGTSVIGTVSASRICLDNGYTTPTINETDIEMLELGADPFILPSYTYSGKQPIPDEIRLELPQFDSPIPYNIGTSTMYIGIDASPMCIAVCVATEQILEISKSRIQSVPHVSYFTDKNRENLFIKVFTYISSVQILGHTKIAIEAPLPSGMHVDKNQSDFTTALRTFLSTRLHTRMIELKPKSIRRFILDQHPDIDMYSDIITLSKERTVGGKCANRFKLYLTLVYFGLDINQYGIDLPDYIVGDEEVSPATLQLIKIVTAHPVSDIIDCIAVTIVLQMLDVFGPVTKIIA